jgi:predicted nucleic acid-binding protein
MILVDTSVWIDHFHRRDPRLQTLLNDRGVLIHPAVVGELACGNLPRRSQTLSYLESLPQTSSIADADETMFVIESRRLSGKCIGWTDAQLVASALISGCRLWTHDRQLRGVVAALGIDY